MIFLSSSLLYLANVEAGCIEDSEEARQQDDPLSGEDCDGRVYGLTPNTIVTNAAVISGLLAALFTPLVGAIVDYTPYRRTLGIWTAILLTIMEAAQIYTVQETWFPMACLLAIIGFVFHLQFLPAYAYLPEIARAKNKLVHQMFQCDSIFLSNPFQDCNDCSLCQLAIGHCGNWSSRANSSDRQLC